MTSTKRDESPPSRLARFARSRTGDQIIHLLCYLWASIGFICGVIFVFFGPQMQISYTLDSAMFFVPAPIWAFAFLSSSILSGALLHASDRAAVYAMCFMSATFSILGIGTLETFFDHSGVPIMAIMCIGLSIAILICTVGYSNAASVDK